MSLDFKLVIDVDTGGTEPVEIELYDSNIGGAGQMLDSAGVYRALQDSYDHPASEVIPVLEAGISLLEDYRFGFINEYGTGLYLDALNFLRNALAACKQHPKARVWAVG